MYVVQGQYMQQSRHVGSSASVLCQWCSTFISMVYHLSLGDCVSTYGSCMTIVKVRSLSGASTSGLAFIVAVEFQASKPVMIGL